MAEHRADSFSPGATHSAGRVIDFLALKLGLETFEADAVDAYFQVPEHLEAVVESALEYLERFARAGRDTGTAWRLLRQLPGRRAAGESWVEHTAGILLDKMGFERCKTAPQFYWSATRVVALELHMGDIHGAATLRGRKQFIKDLSRGIEFEGGDGCELGKPYEHLKRLQTSIKDGTRIQPNNKYVRSTADQLGLTGAKTRTTPGVLTYRATVDATHVLDRVYAQLEVSILVSHLRAPTTRAMEALWLVIRYLLGTHDAYVKL